MLKTQHDNTGGKSSPVVAMFSLDGLRAPDSNANREWNKRNWRLSPRNAEPSADMTSTARAFLEAELRPDIEETQRLLGRQLPW